MLTCHAELQLKHFATRSSVPRLWMSYITGFMELSYPIHR